MAQHYFTHVTTACHGTPDYAFYSTPRNVPQGQERENDLDVGTRHRAVLFQQFYYLRH